jgi:hypothetical protein
MRSNPPSTGTAFHPEIEPEYNGSSTHRSWQTGTGQLAKLPRRRRPGMVALAVALVGVGILASISVYAATNTRVPVIVITANVPAGARIPSGAVGTADVSVSSGVQLIPASQSSQVVGQVAGSDLHPGMLLTASELTTQQPPGPNQSLVPLPVKPSILPASGLGVGTHVIIVATPGAEGQPGASNATPALSSPAVGIIEAVSLTPDTDGYDVVDVLVARSAAESVAAQASTGQIAIIITKRSP